MSVTPIQIWRPSLRAFGLRTIGMFAVTYLLLTPAWLVVDGLAVFASSISLCLLYMFALDDFTEWFEHRKAEWTLTPSALLYKHPHEDLLTPPLPLSEITDVRPRFFWNIQLRLSNGTVVTMHYIDRPRAACQVLRNAIEAEAAS